MNSKSDSSNHRFPRQHVASNQRLLDYLRILNYDRVNTVPAVAGTHQRLYRLLFQNLMKRLVVVAGLCVLVLPQVSGASYNISSPEFAASAASCLTENE